MAFVENPAGYLTAQFEGFCMEAIETVQEMQQRSEALQSAGQTIFSGFRQWVFCMKATLN